MLIAGSSGFGKSTLATALIEKLAAQGYQICVIDPEADYDELHPAIVLGDADHEPVAEAATVQDEADPKSSRARIREIVERRYTAPAQG